jgi:hypothetical protein
MVFFYQFVKGIIERYPELYEGNGVASEYQINFGKKWGSYTAVVDLANGDIRFIDEVVKEPLEKCLLLLAFKADKNHLEDLVHKEAMKKNG